MPSPPSATPPSEHARGLTPDGRLKSGRLAGKTMAGAIWVLSWPIIIESLLNSLVPMTDTVLAAGLPNGGAATDAIAGASYIMWFIGLIIMALSVGATALVSRSVGAGRMAVASTALTQTIVLAAVTGVAVGVFVAVAASPVTSLLSMTPEAAHAFDRYMLVIAAGVPFVSVLFAGIACSRGAGDSIRPLRAMVARNIVNILVSFALSGVSITRTKLVDGQPVDDVLLANPFNFDMGVVGIAIGTVVGDAVGAAIILFYAASGTWGIRLRRKRLKPHWPTIRRLVRVGVPNFLETFGLWIGNFLVLVMVGRLGAEGLLGSHLIAIRVEAISFTLGFAMGHVAATLTGQYLGAGSARLAARAVWACAGGAAVMMGLLGIAFISVPTEVVSVLTRQAVHLQETPPLLVLCGLVQVPFAIAIVTRAALRGAGDVKVVMALTWFSTYLVRLPLAYALSGVDLTTTSVVDGETVTRVLFENPFRDEPSLAGLWLALCIELGLRAVFFSARFLQGGWKRVRV